MIISAEMGIALQQMAARFRTCSPFLALQFCRIRAHANLFVCSGHFSTLFAYWIYFESLQGSPRFQELSLKPKIIAYGSFKNTELKKNLLRLVLVFSLFSPSSLFFLLLSSIGGLPNFVSRFRLDCAVPYF